MQRRITHAVIVRASGSYQLIWHTVGKFINIL